MLGNWCRKVERKREGRDFKKTQQNYNHKETRNQIHTHIKILPNNEGERGQKINTYTLL